jgi:PIN domain nuclease of toxin-antitoxin system
VGPVLSDTHALIWHLAKSPSLSPQARSLFLEADQGRQVVLVPSIVLVEVVYLTEHHKVPTALIQRIVDLVGEPGTGYRLLSLDLGVARALERIPRETVPDLPDRVVAASGLMLQLPVVTRDARIRSLSEVRTAW